MGMFFKVGSLLGAPSLLLSAFVFARTATQAQGNKVLSACYVPGVGAVYLIKETGIPANCVSSGHTEFSWDQRGAPAGAVMFFDLANCPTGWSGFAAAQGRAIVGVPAGGQLAATVGTPLLPQEDRTHAHTVNPVSTVTTSAGAHIHSWGAFTSAGTWQTYNAAGNAQSIIDWSNGLNEGAGVGYFPLALEAIPASTATYYTTQVLGHTHNVDIAVTTSGTAATGNVMPYVQLLACRRD